MDLQPLVRIPEPCPIKLEAMTSVHGGFHCVSCSKVVVDFREKSNEEILNVIQSAGEQRTCGIFRKDQASRGPKPTFELARFAAAVILAFGSFLFMIGGIGCATTGEPQWNKQIDSAATADSVAAAEKCAKSNADSPLIGDSIVIHPDTICNIVR